MKILIDLRKLSKTPTGIGVYIEKSICSILQNKNYFGEIIGITDILGSDNIKELNKKIKIHVFGENIDKSFVKGKKYNKFIEKIYFEESIDLFWQPNNLINYKFRKNIRILTTIHDFFPITHKKYIPKIYRLYFKFFMRKTVRRANYILCVSNQTKRELMKFYCEKLRSKKIRVIYNIVNLNKNIQGINKNFFLYIGSLERRKGFDLLLDAYIKYYEISLNPFKLVIAGVPKEDLMLKKLNKLDPKILEKIDYKGYITEVEKTELLSKMTAFVFPSRAEGFGIPPLEAMSYGKPLVLSNLEIFKEILGDEHNYFSFKGNETENLCAELLKKEMKKPKDIEKILNKYSEKNIGTELGGFFSEIFKEISEEKK